MPKYQYQEIADDLEQKILGGVYPPGSKLPSRSALVDEYGVSEPTIDRAMMVLRFKNLIESLPGVGVYVRE